MNVVLLHGQDHKGSTYHISKILTEKIKGNKEIKEYFLPRDLNHFCLGRYACIEDRTACPYHEDKQKIMDSVLDAESMIFMTPTYCMLPSASMEAFIDLTFTWWMSHKPDTEMFSKRAVVISTAAGVGTKQATKAIANALLYWAFHMYSNTVLQFRPKTGMRLIQKGRKTDGLARNVLGKTKLFFINRKNPDFIGFFLIHTYCIHGEPTGSINKDFYSPIFPQYQTKFYLL